MKQFTIEEAHEKGYVPARVLPSGECAGIHPQLFTTGLFVGLDKYGYRTRYCYETPGEAVFSLGTWDGFRDPPGNWIKEKGFNFTSRTPVDRKNPNYVPTEGENV